MDQSVIFPENFDLRYTDKSANTGHGGGSHYMPHAMNMVGQDSLLSQRNSKELISALW